LWLLNRSSGEWWRLLTEWSAGNGVAVVEKIELSAIGFAIDYAFHFLGLKKLEDYRNVIGVHKQLAQVLKFEDIYEALAS